MAVRRNVATLACSAALAVSLPAAYLAMGGGSYEPSSVRNPCAERSWRDPGSFQAVVQQIALSALDGAACHFGVSREALTIALATSGSRERFAREHHVDDKELGNAVRRGLERSARRRRARQRHRRLPGDGAALRHRKRARRADGAAGRRARIPGRGPLSEVRRASEARALPAAGTRSPWARGREQSRALAAARRSRSARPHTACGRG